MRDTHDWSFAFGLIGVYRFAGQKIKVLRGGELGVRAVLVIDNLEADESPAAAVKFKLMCSRLNIACGLGIALDEDAAALDF